MSREDYGRGSRIGRDWDDDDDEIRSQRRGPRSSDQYRSNRLEPAGTGDYGRRRARLDQYDDERDNERGFFERAADEVRSWFGDDEAERRREMDGRFDDDDDSGYPAAGRSRTLDEPVRLRTGGYGPQDRPSGYTELGQPGAGGRRGPGGSGRRGDELNRGSRGGSRDIAPIGVTNRSYDASNDFYGNADNAGSYGAGRLETDVRYDPRRQGTGAQTHGTFYGQSTGHGVPVDRYSGHIIESSVDTGTARGAAGYGLGDEGTRGYRTRGAGSTGASHYGGGTLGATYGSVLGRGGDLERATERGPHYGKGPKGYRRSDERIREDVNERLMDDDRIDASEIDIEVKDGAVTLTGKVDDRRTKWMVEDLVETVHGVKDVQNNLRVDRSIRPDGVI